MVLSFTWCFFQPPEMLSTRGRGPRAWTSVVRPVRTRGCCAARAATPLSDWISSELAS